MHWQIIADPFSPIIPKIERVSNTCHLGVTFEWWEYCGLCFWHKPTELAHSFFFLFLSIFCSCVYFCLYGPFSCASFHKFSRQLSAFSLCSSDIIFAVSVLSIMYLFMKVSVSSNIILCRWLGLKHQLTNLLLPPYFRHVTSLWYRGPSGNVHQTKAHWFHVLVLLMIFRMSKVILGNPSVRASYTDAWMKFFSCRCVAKSVGYIITPPPKKKKKERNKKRKKQKKGRYIQACDINRPVTAGVC